VAWLPGFLLVAAVFIAYLRVRHAGFIWDDDDHLIHNPCIVGPLGFAAIWTTSRAVYYPLVLTSFWIQHALWGLHSEPYHLVNVATHAVCAILLWQVLRRLNVAGAWLGAALWALHPVQVESVAWITEQKNTQSCLFYLLSILFFLRWLETAGAPGVSRARPYAVALLCAILANLSKSSTVMLPAVLMLCWWWRDRGWRWRNLLTLAPFFTLSVVAGLWTIWEQKYANHALGPEWSQSWPERAVIAGKDICFYLGKLAWPHPLTFIYPRWATDATQASAFVPLIAVVCAMFLLWLVRAGRLRPVFFAAAYFVISIFPVLSFFNVYFFRYSFVGDHFQYLASMGPLALAGAGIAWACKSIGGEERLLYPVAAGALAIVLGMLTYLQCGVYYNIETLWRSTLADNPDAWIAHFNLADILVRKGRLDEAVAHYREHLRLFPNSEECLGNLANVLLMQGHAEEAAQFYGKLLIVNPDSAEGHANLSAALLRLGKVNEAIRQAGKAVELSRHKNEAGEGHNHAVMLRALATAYARAGRFPEAIQTATLALQSAESQSNAGLAATLRAEMEAYQAAARPQASP
jgi:Flp pilus assembly protein TadD